jgi:hypothetical protein
VANTPTLHRDGAVGFIDWLDLFLIFVNKGVKLLFTLLQLCALEVHVLAEEKNQCVWQ